MTGTTCFKFVGAILLASAALIGSSFASNTGDTVIEGNIVQDEFILTAPSSLDLPAVYPGHTSSVELELKITSNSAPWSVKVKSDSQYGTMREFEGNDYSNPEASLINPMHVVYGAVNKTLSNEEQDLITGETGIGNEMPYYIEIIQNTDESDSILPSGHKYKIVLTFVGGIGY